ncbi:flagellar FliJ family protein [Acidomonas methanolica]|uniref:flagellar FliJ family protein n=1 Tax=Acidomonas methanolica TaxID=437 RepID=UPI00211A19E3|nr:flagellar FliJ family protein [Acidomonas methanolica]MCQ9154346.1 flagellar export protein FliJ [Acidomonas methanolica]
MKRTPLATLLRLRQQDMAEARKRLAQAAAHEREADAAVTQAMAAMQREHDYALKCDDDGAVEAFGRWLPIGRKAILAARDVARQTALDRTVAQVAFMEAQAALEVVETLMAQQREEARREEERREQQRLDDLWRKGGKA